MLTNDAMSPLFEAVIKATEEAIYNSMFKATTTTGNDSFRGNRRMSRLSSSFVTRPNVARATLERKRLTTPRIFCSEPLCP